jgi:catechol 2,3-dioxygenase-like lactoylglutathione lyase family enzyme
MIKSIDHILIAVKNLEESSLQYEKVLGLKPTWRGKHPSLGTENILFPLENLYLELIAGTSEGFLADQVNDHIKENGESIFGIALEVENIEEVFQSKEYSNFQNIKITSGEGINLDSGAKREWKNIMLPKESTRGVFTLLIEHTSGILPKYESFENDQVERLDHIVINSNDPDGLIELYRDTYGIRLALDQYVEKWGGRMLFFRTNQTTIEAIGINNDADKPIDKAWGLAWTTKDIKKMHARLVSEGVEISDVKDGRKPKTLVATIKSHTCNVPTLLIEHLK